MESRIVNSHGAEIPKKSRSLDLKSLYESGDSKESSKNKSLKRKESSQEGDREKRNSDDNKRKKSRKALPLSSFRTVNDSNTSKSLTEVYNGGFSSRLPDSESLKKSGLSQKLKNGCSAGLSLSLGDSGAKIPRRKRGFVGRNKFEGGQVLKVAGQSSSKLVGVNEGVKLTSEVSATQNESPKVKQKKLIDDLKENRKSEPSSVQHVKEEDDVASYSAVNDGDSSVKKSRRNPRKRKDAVKGGKSVAKKAESFVDPSANSCDDFHEDDEENLEENAARMLSSRFDPSCTGFSSNNQVPQSPSENGLSVLLSSGQNASSASKTLSGSESTSFDASGRVLRPRKRHKEKGNSRKRRHFYEIFSGDLDASWVLNRRIKVFWPLDKSWYYGLVNDYDRERKLHHVKYDDRDEEWINLKNERFKLLLFPSEVPSKSERKRSRRDRGPDNGIRKLKVNNRDNERINVVTEDDSGNGNYMDSEPIISWLARSSHRVKSLPSRAVKRQKTSASSLSSLGQPLLYDDEAVDENGSQHGFSLKGDKLKLSRASALSDRPVDGRRIKNSSLGSTSCPKDSKHPIVYFRRRFRRTDKAPYQVSVGNCFASRVSEFFTSHASVDEFQDLGELGVCLGISDPEGDLLFSDNLGQLQLNVSLLHSSKFRLGLSFPLPSVSDNLFGTNNFWPVHTLLLLQCGTVMTIWPMVHLEILFVDNEVGLRFLLFEGSLKQAVAFVFQVLTVFYRPTEQGKYADLQLPVTSIRFKISCCQDFKKQILFAFYNFHEVKPSKWMFLDSKLNRHCLLSRQLPLSECTYDNINALQNGTNQLLSSPTCRDSSSLEGLRRRRCRQGISVMGASKESSFLEVGQFSSESEKKNRNLPLFALSFGAAPTFFLSLHLKLLMEHSVARISFGDHDSIEQPGSSGNLMLDESFSREERVNKSSETIVEKILDASSKGDASGTELRTLGISVSGDECGKNSLQKFGNGDQIGDGISACSHEPEEVAATAMVPLQKQRHEHSESEHGLLPKSPVIGDKKNADGKADFFHSNLGNGPKKPRTQVSYSMPFGGLDYSSKNKGHHQRSLPHKRIRRANEKRSSDVSRGSERNLESLSCDANVLITIGDRGWRESGAQIVLELFDHNEWKLAVKVSGSTRFSYKAHQFLQPGSTNRFTHAMMWKGGKEWILEFIDRSQWALFKEMHEECYNRNIRAASVKNIPIPGVRVIEEYDDNGADGTFFRSSSKYLRQAETDVEMALDPSRVLYDMDSDDEQWISRIRNSSVNDANSSSLEISDEMFEKTMDTFEKAAYTQQCDQFESDEIQELISGVASMKVVRAIYEHWRQKRQRVGMPLIRHLQPPLWERYQQQLREWELAMSKVNPILPNGCSDKVPQIEKPPMFAFCLKPRGLEVPNKGSKQRSQRKISVSGQSNPALGDHEGCHSFGRRSNGFLFGDERGSDGFDKNHHQKLQRSKSKKFGTFLSSNDTQMMASYSPRLMGKRNGIHRWNMGFSEWPSQRHYFSDGFQRHGPEQLDNSDVDEYRVRDATSAAQHALKMAKFKREKAQRMLFRADLAIHKAVVALMTAEAIKEASEDFNGDG
ncbi:hypothetical protein CCACVL1_29260 [Corchorus capsularis]|uniref:Enhancer of polycomb-like protein n=1 Tax=Corchorus capsularis TaxID=210143 RepID=A0A1R3G2M9_COCAP|nr:hypothetical protein CCACVL1_29260 [Corchorus capsularis]